MAQHHAPDPLLSSLEYDNPPRPSDGSWGRCLGCVIEAALALVIGVVIAWCILWAGANL